MTQREDNSFYNCTEFEWKGNSTNANLKKAFVKSSQGD